MVITREGHTQGHISCGHPLWAIITHVCVRSSSYLTLNIMVSYSLPIWPPHIYFLYQN